MKLRSGKRIGQSGSELSLAIVYSFFLHVLVALAAVFLYIKASPKIHVPVFYQVMLVSQPVDLAEAPPKEDAPPPPKKEPAPKRQEAAPKVVKAIPKKDALPDLADSKKKEPAEKSAEKVKEQPSAAATGSVTVTTPQIDEKFSYYIGLLRAKIEPNWKPTPDAKDAKAKVIFTINRSGVLLNVNLDAEHSKSTYAFQQAAIRAIYSSNPFPALPEDLPKQSLEFTVDLVPKQ